MRATAGAWMRANLTTQGYCLGDDERRRLAVGLRFSTGLCLSLVVVALALQSQILVFALCGIGVVASFVQPAASSAVSRGARSVPDGPRRPPSVSPVRRRVTVDRQIPAGHPRELHGTSGEQHLAARDPFDYLWNHGLRHVLGAPVLPPNPRRRRDAFKVATVWLALVGALFAAGAATAGLVLGGMLVAACALVTSTNLCLPSETFAWLERRRAPGGITTITT